MNDNKYTEQFFLKILGHCAIINENLKNVNTYNDFVNNSTLLDSNLFHLQQIGLVAQNIPLNQKLEYDYINFQGLSTYKTFEVSDYIEDFSPFLDDVFTMLKNDIPDLENSLIEILTSDFRLAQKDIQKFQEKYTTTRCFDFDLVYDRFQKNKKDDGMEM